VSFFNVFHDRLQPDHGGKDTWRWPSIILGYLRQSGRDDVGCAADHQVAAHDSIDC
jgi:hypothetical protein